MMMSTVPSTDQNTSTSSSTNKPRHRIVYSSSSDDDIVPPDFVSSTTPSQINYGPAGLAQSFGITAEKKILSLEVLSKMAKDERVDVIQMVYGECQTIDNENQLPRSDTGDELHPVFSPLLQSGHTASRVHTLLRLTNFEPQSLGFTPV